MFGNLYFFKWDIFYIFLNLRNLDINIYMCVFFILEFGIEEKLFLNLV